MFVMTIKILYFTLMKISFIKWDLFLISMIILIIISINYSKIAKNAKIFNTTVNPISP